MSSGLIRLLPFSKYALEYFFTVYLHLWWSINADSNLIPFDA